MVKWNLSKADTIGAEKTVCLIEVSALKRISLWEFDLKSVCFVPKIEYPLYIEVSALDHVRFKEIPLYILLGGLSVKGKTTRQEVSTWLS